jgi:hypothetical protein
MRGYKTRGNASRYKSGQAVPPTHPTHPDRASRLVGLIAAGALGGLGGGLAVGFATAGGSGLSVAAAHQHILAATTLSSGAPRSVMLASAFFISPLPSPSPTPTGPNKPVPTASPSASASPNPGDPNASAPLPTASPTPTPTPTKSTSTGKGSGKGAGKGSGSGSSGGNGSGSNLGSGLGSAGGGATPLVNVPGVSPQDPTGLFPTVAPGSGSNPGGKGKRIDAVTTAATTPLDTLIPGQVVGLAVLIGAIALAFVRFSLRTSPPSDSQRK